MGTGTAHPANASICGDCGLPHADSGPAEPESSPLSPGAHEADERTAGPLSLGAAHFTQKKSDKLAFPSFPFFH